MRIAFFGTPDVAVPSLHALVAAPHIDVVCVVTNPDRPKGRSATPVASPVKHAALSHGLDVLQPERPRDIAENLDAMQLDACAVVAYGALLPRDVLAIPAHGFVNLHFSLLPRWRGAAPVQWAIRSGDTHTGITTFVLDEGMDTGPTLTSLTVALQPNDTTESVLDDLSRKGAPLLVDAITGLVAGTIVPTPQPADGATLAPKIRRDDVALDFAGSAQEIDALTRSADPQPGAHARFRDDTIKVFRARHTDENYEPAAPGTIVALTRNGPVVACGEGHVIIETAQLPGKPRRDGVSLINGARLSVGEQFHNGVLT